ncbi:WW domain binding protein 1-like b [Aplochiton taeniatus]
MTLVVCSALTMGLFLHVVGPVTPTDSTADGSLLHCDGVNNQSYVCESGHCCGESQCCSYYYELWWFWLVWAIIFILSCCCVCHHRRTKHRLQQQQRQHEINLIAYREAHNYTSVPFYFRFLPNYLLPDYEEVVNRPPTPPPPYSALHTGPSSVVSSPLTTEQQEGHCPSTQTTPVPPVSDTLCSRPSLEESHAPTIGYRQTKPDNKPSQTTQEGDPLLSGSPQDGLSMQGPVSLEKKAGDGLDCCKDPLLRDLAGSEGSGEEKDRLLGGRRRRFTGDSGIEVCVCSTRGSSSSGGGGGQEGKDLRELESLLRCRCEEEQEEDEEEEEADAGDFCDGCARAIPAGDEEQVMADSEKNSAQQSSPQEPPVCLLLQTINEQEGAPHGNNTEPQG